MFLLRAAFWLAAVVVLMPREPDLGIPAALDSASCVVSADCIDGAAWLSDFRSLALASLARVRADLEANGQG